MTLKRIWYWLRGIDYIEGKCQPITYYHGHDVAYEKMLAWHKALMRLDEEKREDAEYQRRMRGGIEYQGKP